MSARLILKEIGSRINNIGTIVDTDPNNDETTSYMGKMLKGDGAFGGGLKDIKDNFSSKDAKDVADAAKDVASAVSDKNIKDIAKTSNTADIIEKAYKGLDDIIYKYNSKGQALGEDDIINYTTEDKSLFYKTVPKCSEEELNTALNGISLEYPIIEIKTNYGNVQDKVIAFKNSEDFKYFCSAVYANKILGRIKKNIIFRCNNRIR